MHRVPIVFDTVCLANFLLTGSVEILTERYSGRARITEQVFDELTVGMRIHPKLSGITRVLKRKHFSLETMTLPERETYADLVAALGRGESSCISIAFSRRWTMATDDRAARGRCFEKGIPVTGTIGILKAACIDKQLAAHRADELLTAMITEGFYSPVSRVSDLL